MPIRASILCRPLSSSEERLQIAAFVLSVPVSARQAQDPARVFVFSFCSPVFVLLCGVEECQSFDGVHDCRW